MSTIVKERFPTLSKSRDGSISYVRTWAIKFDSVGSPESAMSQQGIPSVGESKTVSGVVLYCSRLDSSVLGDDGHLWTVTAEYREKEKVQPVTPEHSDSSSSSESSSSEGSNLNKSPIISATTECESVVADAAWDDQFQARNVPIVNSAGDPFATPAMMQKFGQGYNVRWFKSDWNPTLESTYTNTVNHSDVTIAGRTFPAGTALLRSLVGGRVRDTDGSIIWEVEADILYRPDGHRVKVLDNGFMAKFGGKKWYIAIDNSGTAGLTDDKTICVDDPYPLNGHGSLGDPADPKFLDFAVYKEEDWGGIEFPRQLGLKG